MEKSHSENVNYDDDNDGGNVTDFLDFSIIFRLTETHAA